jgi:histidinol phosphatase-like PHP family hydrolase
MRLAKAAGCKFTFGTDSHSLAGLDKIRRADDLSDIIGITEEDLAEFVK